VNIGSVRRRTAEVLRSWSAAQILRASGRKVETRTEVLGFGRHLGRSPNVAQGGTSMGRERARVDLLNLLGLRLMARPAKQTAGR